MIQTIRKGKLVLLMVPSITSTACHKASAGEERTIQGDQSRLLHTVHDFALQTPTCQAVEGEHLHSIHRLLDVEHRQKDTIAVTSGTARKEQHFLLASCQTFSIHVVDASRPRRCPLPDTREQLHATVHAVSRSNESPVSRPSIHAVHLPSPSSSSSSSSTFTASSASSIPTSPSLHLVLPPPLVRLGDTLPSRYTTD
ncbi:unnamed protein product [Taenia asiatica]|uniref:Secreted protein n=1 Tax=Taenia asiatica TaxID=60517 RepID=A0A0R3VZT1_TAEAS|nr:unnamed protein product [Taenia asiatica]